MFRAIPTYIYIILFLVSVSLGGCGIRPSEVILPNDSPHSQFPNTYPSP